LELVILVVVSILASKWRKKQLDARNCASILVERVTAEGGQHINMDITAEAINISIWIYTAEVINISIWIYPPKDAKSRISNSKWITTIGTYPQVRMNSTRVLLRTSWHWMVLPGPNSCFLTSHHDSQRIFCTLPP
jgi:hypothetical protein